MTDANLSRGSYETLLGRLYSEMEMTGDQTQQEALLARVDALRAAHPEFSQTQATVVPVAVMQPFVPSGWVRKSIDGLMTQGGSTYHDALDTVIDE